MFGMRASLKCRTNVEQASLKIREVPCSLTSRWLHLFQGLTV